MLEQSGVGRIMEKYGVSRGVASYLILIHPDEKNKWRGYESTKNFLSKNCSSSCEYEQAIRYLIDRLRI